MAAINVQNIPADWKEVKEVFVPKLDAFMYFDYKQIEPRLVGYFSNIALGNDDIAEQFRQGIDMYTRQGQFVFDKPEITEKERDAMKRVFLGIAYGAGAPRVQGIFLEELGRVITIPRAKGVVNEFRRVVPGLFDLRAAVEATLHQRGYILTPWGRHLRVQKPHKALNALIQGTAADLMKHSYIEVKRWLRGQSLESHVVNLIHDEIMLDVTEGEMDHLAVDIPELMRYDEFDSIVPILVDVEWSPENWANKLPYEVPPWHAQR